MNLQKLEEKLNQLQKSSGSSRDKIWKPVTGSSVIRIVPYIHDTEWPFLELYFHFQITKRTIISPISFGNPDPIAEYAEQLRNTGLAEDRNLAYSIEPKQRVYVPILVRGEEDAGIKFWGFGKEIYAELLKTIKDPDYGDITDLKNGMDVVIEYVSPPKGDKKSYPKTSIRVKPNKTPATTDKTIANMIKEMPTVNDIWPEPSYDSLKISLEKFLNNEEDIQKNDTSTDTTGDLFDDANAADIGTVINDIDTAFDDLFG
jgi:hypothetical protein